MAHFTRFFLSLFLAIMLSGILTVNGEMSNLFNQTFGNVSCAKEHHKEFEDCFDKLGNAAYLSSLADLADTKDVCCAFPQFRDSVEKTAKKYCNNKDVAMILSSVDAIKSQIPDSCKPYSGSINQYTNCYPAIAWIYHFLVGFCIVILAGITIPFALYAIRYLVYLCRKPFQARYQ